MSELEELSSCMGELYIGRDKWIKPNLSSPISSERTRNDQPDQTPVCVGRYLFRLSIRNGESYKLSGLRQNEVKVSILLDKIQCYIIDKETIHIILTADQGWVLIKFIESNEYNNFIVSIREAIVVLGVPTSEPDKHLLPALPDQAESDEENEERLDIDGLNLQIRESPTEDQRKQIKPKPGIKKTQSYQRLGEGPADRGSSQPAIISPSRPGRVDERPETRPKPEVRQRGARERDSGNFSGCAQGSGQDCQATERVKVYYDESLRASEPSRYAGRNNMRGNENNELRESNNRTRSPERTNGPPVSPRPESSLHGDYSILRSGSRSSNEFSDSRSARTTPRPPRCEEGYADLDRSSSDSENFEHKSHMRQVREELETHRMSQVFKDHCWTGRPESVLSARTIRSNTSTRLPESVIIPRLPGRHPSTGSLVSNSSTRSTGVRDNGITKQPPPVKNRVTSSKSSICEDRSQSSRVSSENKSSQQFPYQQNRTGSGREPRRIREAFQTSPEPQLPDVLPRKISTNQTTSPFHRSGSQASAFNDGLDLFDRNGGKLTRQQLSHNQPCDTIAEMMIVLPNSLLKGNLVNNKVSVPVPHCDKTIIVEVSIQPQDDSSPSSSSGESREGTVRSVEETSGYSSDQENIYNYTYEHLGTNGINGWRQASREGSAGVGCREREENSGYLQPIQDDSSSREGPPTLKPKAWKCEKCGRYNSYEPEERRRRIRSSESGERMGQEGQGAERKCVGRWSCHSCEFENDCMYKQCICGFRKEMMRNHQDSMREVLKVRDEQRKTIKGLTSR